MGESFSMRMTIGGDLPEDKLPEMVELLLEVNPYITEAPSGELEYSFETLPDSDKWLKDISDHEDHIEIYEYEGSYSDWEALSSSLGKLGLSYDFSCDPKYEYPGTLEIHRPGQPLIQVGTEGEGNTTLHIDALRRILLQYVVSSAELRRLLDRIAPDTDVSLGAFKVVS